VSSSSRSLVKNLWLSGTGLGGRNIYLNLRKNKNTLNKRMKQRCSVITERIEIGFPDLTNKNIG
jgi:hypothetical protein